MISAAHTKDIYKQMPHIMAVFFMRSAFDLRSQGLSKEQAEFKAKEKCRDYPGVSPEVIFPQIPWDKFEIFYPSW